MIRGLAFVPGAPLLLDGLGGRADVLAPLRATCLEAVAALGPGPLVVLGPGPQTRWYDGGAATPDRFRPARTRRAGVAPSTPPYLVGLGLWLVARSGADAHGVVGLAVADEAEMPVPDVPDGVALLVVGDGSACRGPTAPLPDDPRAEAYDAAAATAMAGGDPAGLLALDPGLGGELGASGVVAWRAAARLAGDRPWRARLLADEAPLGVAYLVATWL